MESLLDELVEMFTNERLDSILLKDDEFLKLEDKIKETIVSFDELNLDNEQKLVVDRMVSAYNASSACCSMLSYRQGIFDCIQLLKEMKIL